MNKEELIKIYSAYFPYRLKVNHCNIEYTGEEEFETFITGIFEDCITFQKGADFYYDEDDIWIKPHLYDLSHLTKEIEHEGKKVMPYKLLFYHDLPWESKDAILDEALSFINNEKRLEYSYPYEFWQKLLSMHFNIFGLKENEFINKATLKTEGK